MQSSDEEYSAAKQNEEHDRDITMLVAAVIA